MAVDSWFGDFFRRIHFILAMITRSHTILMFKVISVIYCFVVVCLLHQVFVEDLGTDVLSFDGFSLVRFIYIIRQIMYLLYSYRILYYVSLCGAMASFTCVVLCLGEFYVFAFKRPNIPRISCSYGAITRVYLLLAENWNSPSFIRVWVHYPWGSGVSLQQICGRYSRSWWFQIPILQDVRHCDSNGESWTRVQIIPTFSRGLRVVIKIFLWVHQKQISRAVSFVWA